MAVKLRAILTLLLKCLLCGAKSRAVSCAFFEGGFAMKMSRFSNTGAAAWLVGALLSLAALGVTKAEAADMHQLCRQVHNDDTIQDYSPALHDETVQAFKALASDAQIAPDDSELRAQAQYRCMDGKVMVCFVGANLPCTKMNAARDNPGADEFCRQNPNAKDVPAVATGHDTVYSYRCRNGQAEIADDLWELDERGFAKKLWAELPDR
ncbi:hypothetical protein X772_36805 [Mesorhizobium sp. LSJC280B00]|nr:hypothetical protein X772_36805 [Mesorhizobium sp. LSJC280B00]